MMEDLTREASIVMQKGSRGMRAWQFGPFFMAVHELHYTKSVIFGIHIKMFAVQIVFAKPMKA